MNPILIDLFANAEVTGEDLARVAAISCRVIGYSDIKHYAFFKQLLARPEIKDVLILGVYHGRDIAFMLDILRRSGRRDVTIVGVDKFSDDACHDWPEEKKGMDWGKAGFGTPPNIEAARDNTRSPFVQLHAVTDEIYLASTESRFDAVYLDTSHDYATVKRQLRQVPRVCREDAIICGDDYSDVSNAEGGSWGVKRAVSESFAGHVCFAGWIWASSLNRLLIPQPAASNP